MCINADAAVIVIKKQYQISSVWRFVPCARFYFQRSRGLDDVDRLRRVSANAQDACFRLWVARNSIYKIMASASRPSGASPTSVMPLHVQLRRRHSYVAYDRARIARIQAEERELVAVKREKLIGNGVAVLHRHGVT